MKKLILLCLFCCTLFSCGNNQSGNTPKESLFKETISEKYGSDSEFLNKEGHTQMTEIGMWVFNVGSEKSPMMNQIRLYKDTDNKYYLLDKFEDGSKSLKEVSIKKEGTKFIIEFVPSAKDSYYISESESLIYLKTEGYDNDLKALEGDFNPKAI